MSALRTQLAALRKGLDRVAGERPVVLLTYRRSEPVPEFPPGVDVILIEELVAVVGPGGAVVYVDPATGVPTGEPVPADVLADSILG